EIREGALHRGLELHRVADRADGPDRTPHGSARTDLAPAAVQHAGPRDRMGAGAGMPRRGPRHVAVGSARPGMAVRQVHARCGAAWRDPSWRGPETRS